MQLRNTGNETYVDAVTGKVAEPDAVIDVPDDLSENYENHPIWREVGAPAPAPVVEAAPVEAEPVAEAPVADTNQEVQS